MEFHTNLGVSIFALPSILFWGIIALVACLDLFTVTRDEDHWGWMFLFTTLMVIGISVRVKPSFWVTLAYLAGHFVIGFLYASWRVKSETRLFAIRAQAFLQIVSSFNCKEQWPYDLRNMHYEGNEAYSSTGPTRFDFIFEKLRHRTFKSMNDIQAALVPSNYLASFAGRLVMWTLVWPVFLTGDLTVNLGRSLRRLFMTTLANWFKGIINRNFQTTLPPTNQQQPLDAFSRGTAIRDEV